MSLTVVRDQDLADACSCGCDRTRHVHDGRQHAGACIDCTCESYRRHQPTLASEILTCAGGMAALWLLAIAFWTWS